MSKLSDFLRYLQHEKRSSQHTLTSYETDLRQFSAYLREEFEMEDLTAVSHTQVRSWFASLKGEGISARTIHRKRSSLSTFFKYARRQEWIDSDPIEKTSVPKAEKRLPSFLDEPSMRKLFEEVLQSDGTYEKERDRLMVTLFYESGIRLSELIELKWKDIDPSQAQMKVLGKRNKERILPLSESTLASLLSFRKLAAEQFDTSEKSHLLLTDRGAKLHPKFVYRKVNHYIGVVSTLDKRSPHVLRHTFATHMLNNGAQLNTVKELLGHANLSATQVYTHNSIDQLKRIHEQNHPKG